MQTRDCFIGTGQENVPDSSVAEMTTISCRE